MEVSVIFHHKDNDGKTAARIAYDALSPHYKDLTMIGYDYDESTDFVKDIPNGGMVYVLDISLPVNDMIDLSLRSSKMIWIDHHKDANTAIAPFIENAAQVVYKNGTAAAQLTWEYFNPLEHAPSFVDLVARYDVYKGYGSEFWENTIMPFEYGCRATYETWNDIPEIKHMDNEFIVSMLRTKGVPILEYLQKQANAIAAAAQVINFHGLTAMVLHDIPNAAYYKTPAYLSKLPQILVYPHYSSKKCWKFSLRQGVEKRVNCSQLAALYGGGGHAEAAGFTVKHLEDVNGFF